MLTARHLGFSFVPSFINFLQCLPLVGLGAMMQRELADTDTAAKRLLNNKYTEKDFTWYYNNKFKIAVDSKVATKIALEAYHNCEANGVIQMALTIGLIIALTYFGYIEEVWQGVLLCLPCLFLAIVCIHEMRKINKYMQEKYHQEAPPVDVMGSASGAAPFQSLLS